MLTDDNHSTAYRKGKTSNGFLITKNNNKKQEQHKKSLTSIMYLSPSYPWSVVVLLCLCTHELFLF